MHHRPAVAVQSTFDELGSPLHEVTFVVVDLETTGGSPATCAITEVGAVKVRAGERLGEFQTLVNPGQAIPAFISVLTGISDSMVAGAPRLDTVLPAFLDFAGDAVLVAHNAPFDIGFLKAACVQTGREWPGNRVLDTARLARQVVTRDEAPNCKLSSLARLFRAGTTPDHRALSDARATVDVLHGMIERLGNLGVRSLEELSTFSSRVSPAQRAKRHLAESMPRLPGVYLFVDDRGEVLYVGKSKDLRARVRTYFTAGETRGRMAEMVGLAAKITPVVCATPLEAEVRELRLIAAHKPRYNRRSRFPERAMWLKLTVEAFPRLSRVREVRNDGAAYLGPFGSTRQVELATAAVHEAFRLRQCTPRLSPRSPSAACALADMGRCGAPCDGRETVQQYAVHAEEVRSAMLGDVRPLVEALSRKVTRLADVERYEEAAVHRDRLAAFVRAAARVQRLGALTGIAEMVAARLTDDASWEIVVVRHGRLAGTAVAARTEDPRLVAVSLVASAEVVVPAFGPTPAASAEETECVLRWLERPGVRLVGLDGTWASPMHGAGGVALWADAAGEARSALGGGLSDRRDLRPVHQPAAVSRIAG
ncbi:MAG: DEDD exonuclease domain-containing protein [Spirochaetaceae bacterium]|nr:DEDD exonuclease domain-containing protein [Spirochaetaceae bacterium]